MSLKFIFTPVAQNTIIRPMAEAVCMVRGGETVTYVDTADHKEKKITSENLYFLTLQTSVNGKKVDIDGRTVAFQASHKPAQIQVNVNDVTVMISPKTTVAEAMAQYKRKWRLQSHLLNQNIHQKD